LTKRTGASEQLTSGLVAYGSQSRVKREIELFLFDSPTKKPAALRETFSARVRMAK